MRIGELARRTGVSARLLRYYEEQGLLTAGRAANGYRHYEEDAVATVHRIRTLLDAGLPTELIRAVLPCVRDAPPGVDWCAELREDVRERLAQMDEAISRLQHRRALLARYLTS
ncbi:MerR family transcriptional regulator [Streptomyces durbertensis]|uniref:MerR family transcriptional regulator n=1 Tax=Streptomyces durbertensis TaxID=2448886 RepID=A0ABR6EBS6_9ACTN|nr:MerR family transcriptional regulator [Streptomyces durbertensis]MBB1242787.1 MerR family transcriptional regulator [Streptomyces durbertensis]